jgi:hypothetical protein
MESGLRDLNALSLLAAFCWVLRWPTMTCFSPLFLACSAQPASGHAADERDELAARAQQVERVRRVGAESLTQPSPG